MCASRVNINLSVPEQLAPISAERTRSDVHPTDGHEIGDGELTSATTEETALPPMTVITIVACSYV